jgi:hypothetical protein
LSLEEVGNRQVVRPAVGDGSGSVALE